MALLPRGHWKVVDKFQFDQNGFTSVNGIDQVPACHSQTKQYYTLKRIGLTNTNNKEKYNYVIRQLTLLKKLDHSVIIKCHKLLKTSTNLYLVFDQLRGKSLTQLLNIEIPHSRSLQIAEELCGVLKYLEKVQVCHCQLDTDSIVVLDKGTIKLINFGCAQELQEGQAALGEWHQTRKLNQYTPPQVKNMVVNMKSDIYSLGMIVKSLFEEQQTTNREKLQKNNSQSKKRIKMENEKILEFSNKMIEQSVTKRAGLTEVCQFFQKKLYLVHDLGSKSDKLLLFVAQPITHKSSSMSDRDKISQTNRSSSPQHIPSNLKLRRTTTCEIGSQTQDCLFISRRVLSKRNFSRLLLQMAQLCTRTIQVGSQKCLWLSFILLKKSTIVISQLAKFMETGRADGLRMDDKLKDKISRHVLFNSLQKLIRKQMRSLQEKLTIVAQTLSNRLKKSNGCNCIIRELQIEAIDHDFMRKCVSQFLREITAWVAISQPNRNESVLSPQRLAQGLPRKDLAIVYIMGELSQHRSYEQFYQIYFSESGCKLWQQQFMREIMAKNQKTIASLILAQGDISYNKNEESKKSLNMVVSRKKL